MGSHSEEVVQNFEIKRVEGAPKGHLFAPLIPQLWTICDRILTICDNLKYHRSLHKRFYDKMYKQYVVALSAGPFNLEGMLC